MDSGNLDLVSITVDGSLENPYAAGAVAAWTMILVLVAAWMVRSATRGETVARIGVFAGLAAGTRWAQHFIGNLLYWVSDRSIIQVGFLGGPPIWIGPTVSCIAALAMWIYTFRRKSAGRR